MLFVLHRTADFNDDSVVAVVRQHIYDFIELVELLFAGQIDLETAERALRRGKANAAGNETVIGLRLLKHFADAVEQTALALGIYCDYVSFPAHCKGVLGT